MGEKPLPAGTLVQVKQSAVAYSTPYSGINRNLTDVHGWLFFVENYDADEDVYTCKSLATGESEVDWYPNEITPHKKENTDG